MGSNNKNAFIIIEEITEINLKKQGFTGFI